MLRLWIALSLIALLLLAVWSALAKTPPARLWAAALGIVCAALVGGGLIWIFSGG